MPSQESQAPPGRVSTYVRLFDTSIHTARTRDVLLLGGEPPENVAQNLSPGSDQLEREDLTDISIATAKKRRHLRELEVDLDAEKRRREQQIDELQAEVGTHDRELRTGVHVPRWLAIGRHQARHVGGCRSRGRRWRDRHARDAAVRIMYQALPISVASA